MVKKIKFGSKDDANEQREKFEQYLSDKDDRRKKTVKLSEDAPDRVLEKARSAGFESEEAESHSAGMRELSESEQEQLNRVHRNFSWQENGFEAMRVKGALQSKGVTDWKNYYEPGEGISGAVQKLEQGKQRSARGGGKVAMDDRRDPDDQVNQRRRQQQTSRVRGRQLESAKEAAVTEGDAEAKEFITEERGFGEDVFNIRHSESPSGVPQASGSDLSLLEQRNRQRSKRARRLDNRRAAKITRDPLQWASAPGQFDFPGIDTVDPQDAHNRRSKKAREKDRNELAPKADTLNEWADDKDHLDWPGVDTPRALGLGGDGVDLPDADSVLSKLAEGRRTAPETPSSERNTSAPEPFTTDLSQRDVSLAPEEAFEGVGTGSDPGAFFAGGRSGRANEQRRAAGGEEADLAFTASEERRASGEMFADAAPTQQKDVLETDDQQTLGGGRANNQARLAGGETGSVESETETIVEQNSGGLFSDERTDVGESSETEQMTPDAFQVAEGGQDTFGDFLGGGR